MFSISIGRHAFSFSVTLFAIMIIVVPISRAQCLDYSSAVGDSIVTTFNFHPHGQNDMEVVGDIVWIARSTYGALVSVDMSDPGNPTTLGTEPVTVMDETFHVVTSGSFAYVSYVQWGGPSGVRIFDISDPANPADIGDFISDSFGLVLGLEVVGNLLYVSTRTYSNTGLAILDVSTPSTPFIVGEISLQNATRVAVKGDHALVCNDSWNPYVVDVSDPTNPVWAAWLMTSGTGKDMVIEGDLAYVATGTALEIVDVTDPLNSALLGSIDLPGIVYNVTIHGSLAYVSCRENGVQVVSVSNPELPVLKGVIGVPDFPYISLAVGGSLLSLTSSNMYVTPLQCPMVSAVVDPAPPVVDLSFYASPNPFNPKTSLSFNLQSAGLVNLTIYDTAGHLVQRLYSGELTAGSHRFNWNGTDISGRQIASGVYHAILKTKEGTNRQKLMLLK